LVQAVNRDATMLFPQSCLLLEVEGITAADPQVTYGQRRYLRDSQSFGSPLPPATITRLQFYMQLAHDKTISEDEALEAMVGTTPAVIMHAVATLPPPRQFPCKMLLAGQAFSYADADFLAIAGAMGWSQDKIEALFTAAAKL
jgi:hypothetical protein